MIRLTLTLLALGLAGCAATPAVQGGPALSLSPELIAAARIARLDVEVARPALYRYAQTQSEEAEIDRPDSMTAFSLQLSVGGEIENELRRCAAGARSLELRVRIDQLAYDERLRSLVDGKGYDRIEGLAEFVDPQSGEIVGRYAIHAQTGSGALLQRIVSDRTDALGEAFGRELCRQAFGRNPRGPAIENSTPG